MSSGIHLIVLCCFLLSGASGLMYEVLWLRMLVLVFGSTTFAISTVLTTFMAGLALGSWLFSRVSDRLRHPLLIYGLLELGIGGAALVIPSLVSGLTPFYQWLWRTFTLSLYVENLLRFLLILIILLPPTVFMGGTLPVLSRFYARREKEIGGDVGLLYACNTLGAVGGVVATGFFLLPAFGMQKATTVAVIINLLIGTLILLVARKRREEEGLVPVALVKDNQIVIHNTAPGAGPSRGVILAVLSVFACSGGTAMLYEVAWSRGLTLVMGSSTYAFSIMLATFLVGLSLGSFLMARWVDRIIRPVLVLGILQIGIGLSAFGGLYLFPQLPLLFLLLFSVLGSTPAFLYLGEFLLAFLIMFLPTLLLGGVFPLVVRICTTTLHTLGHLVGKAYALNTLGTIVGAFAAGFILLPTLGIWQSILLALSLNVAMGLGLLLTSIRERISFYAATGLLIVLAVLSLVHPPAWDPLVMSSGVYRDAPRYLQMYRSPADLFSRITSQYRTLFYREGVTATVAVVERPSLGTAPTRTLSIDGKVDASTGTDMATQILSGHLPLLLSPQAEEVLVIGFASGVTVGAVTRYPVREIVAVEIEPAVMEASRFFDAVNHRPLQDCRVKVVLNDARNYLLVTPQRFDVIISEPSNPWMSGPAKLFTREFFQLGKEHLKSGGIFTQWLQLYGLEPVHLKTLVRTFQSVFPAVLLFQPSEGDLLLLGSEGEWPVPFLQMARRMAEPAIAEDLRRIGIHTPYDLLLTFRLGTQEIKGYTGKGPYNTDENGLIEFAAPRSLYADTLATNQDEIQRVTHGIGKYIQDIDEPAAQQDFFLGLAFHYLTRSEAQGSPFVIQDRLREAVTSVQQALTRGPSATGHWILGEIALRQGAEREVLSAWQHALKLEPAHFATLLSLVLYHQQRKEYPQADRFLTLLDQYYADNALVRYYHGINRYFLGDYQAAIADLETAVHRGFASFNSTAEVSRNPSLPPAEYFLLPELSEHQLAYYYLSLAYAKLDEPSLATTAHEQFLSDLEQWRLRGEQEPTVLTQSKLWQRLQTTPEHEIPPEERELAQWIAQEVGEPLALYYHGITLYLLGYYAEAVTKLSQVLTLLEKEQKSPLTHYYLGLAYYQLHQFSQAKTHLEAFLRDLQNEEQLDYQRAEAQRRLRELSVDTY